MAVINIREYRAAKDPETMIRLVMQNPDHRRRIAEKRAAFEAEREAETRRATEREEDIAKYQRRTAYLAVGYTALITFGAVLTGLLI